MTISSTLNPRAMLADYEHADPEMKAAVEGVMRAALAVIESHGFKVAVDDRCAELEGVVFNFIREAN